VIGEVPGVEVSVKVTARGRLPAVGVLVNVAVGGVTTGFGGQPGSSNIARSGKAIKKTVFPTERWRGSILHYPSRLGTVPHLEQVKHTLVSAVKQILYFLVNL
jgi:hypothetical protein